MLGKSVENRVYKELTSHPEVSAELTEPQLRWAAKEIASQLTLADMLNPQGIKNGEARLLEVLARAKNEA